MTVSKLERYRDMTPSGAQTGQSASDEMTRRCGRYAVNLTHLGKVLYRQDGITKQAVIDYYQRVSSWMLPQLRDRPLTMERYPDGIHHKGFFHKEMPEYFPEWFQHTTVATGEGKQRVPVCNNMASLLYLANQASLAQHPWLSRRGSINQPDQLIFDLDPPGDKFEPVRQAALDVMALLDELSMVGYVKTTGSRGLHVVVPIRGGHNFDQVRDFARDCARLLVARKPGSYTLEQRIANRGGRLYLDVQRNSYGQTVVAPYSLRAKPGAPVATPIHRAQLQDPALHAGSYTIENIFRSLSQRTDPWKNQRRHARGIDAAAGRLEKLLSEQAG